MGEAKEKLGHAKDKVEEVVDKAEEKGEEVVDTAKDACCIGSSRLTSCHRLDR